MFGLKTLLRRCFALMLSEEVKNSFAMYRQVSAECLEAQDKLQASQRWSKELERQTELMRASIDDLNSDIGALRGELAASRKEVEMLTGLLSSEGEIKQVAVDREARVRTELADVEEALEDAKHEIQMLGHQLECAEAHNTLLSEIHSTDVERRKKERAIEIRQQVEAETATRYAVTEAADAA